MTKYKFRAECLTDVLYFCNYCPQGSLRNIECNNLEKIENIPDVEVTFESHLSSSDLRQICAIIEDGHVILQTIEPIVSYTGERNYEL